MKPRELAHHIRSGRLSRRQMLQPVPVSLNLLLGEASGMLRRLMPENIELKLALDPKTGRLIESFGERGSIVLGSGLDTRAIIDAIHAGALASAPTRQDAVFGFDTVTACPGVDPRVLAPRDAQWPSAPAPLAVMEAVLDAGA